MSIPRDRILSPYLSSVPFTDMFSVLSFQKHYIKRPMKRHMIISIRASGIIVLKCHAYTDSIVCQKSAVSITHYSIVYSRHTISSNFISQPNTPLRKPTLPHNASKLPFTSQALFLHTFFYDTNLHLLPAPKQNHPVKQRHSHFMTLVCN